MKLSLAGLNILAEMICGGRGGMSVKEWENFPYRSSSYLTKFFRQCNLPFEHDGSTRGTWVYQVLTQLNEESAINPSLPPDNIIEVIRQLLNPADFEEENHTAAVNEVNRKVLLRDNLQVKFIDGQCIIENMLTHTTTRTQSGRLLNKDEQNRWRLLSDYFDDASEDEFTEQILVKLFSLLGYERIRVSGHKDKQMEFGKDVWMKFYLPTQHVLYVGIQVKKGRIHASGSDLEGNVGGILAQLLMLMTYPIFDAESNSKHLLDHVILVSSGEITKQARTLLSEFLNNAMRRNVMFLDKEDLLDLCVRYAVPIPDKMGGNPF